MASDTAYESFLDKANDQSSSASGSATQSSGKSEPGFKALKASDADVPPALNRLGQHYLVSDADYPFEAVSYTITEPLGKDSIRKLLDTNDIESMSLAQFDPKNQYAEVVDSILEAAGETEKKHVQVFRVQHAGSRVEYFLLCPHEDDNRVVGARAKAVE